MNDDEHDRIYLEHKLEWHRIWWGKILTLMILGLGWFVAVTIGQEVASGFRKAELEHQFDLDVAKESRKIYFAKNFAVQMAAESLHIDLYETYAGAVYSFWRGIDSIRVQQSSGAVTARLLAMKDMIRRHYIYLDTLYADQAQNNCFLYDAVLLTSPTEWKEYQDFFWAMKNTLSTIGRAQLQIRMGIDPPRDPTKQHLLKQYEPRRKEGIIDSAVLRQYLRDEFTSWQSFRQRVNAQRDSLN